MSEAAEKLSLVVLISGGGTNLQAIIDAATSGELPAEVKAVISSREDAYGLERARRAGIPTETVLPRQYPGRENYDRALQATIDQYAPQLVVLAGFMRILSAGFVRHYAGRMLNIHPSLLPEYRGLNTHARALEDRATRHGASVHFVTEELDGGPVIVQASVPVHADDSEAALAARVLQQEHRIYPLVIRWFAEGRLRLQDDTVMLDGKPLRGPCHFNAETGAIESWD